MHTVEADVEEIYITYKDGERVLTTTAENVLSQAYLRSGTTAWSALAALAPVDAAGAPIAGTVGTIGERAASAARRIRPAWADATLEFDPAIHSNGKRNHAGNGHRHGAPANAEGAGTSVAGDTEETWDHIYGGGMADRARSHRHCPGCNGHERVQAGLGLLLFRIVCAWFFGWGAVWAGDIGVDLKEYTAMTILGFFTAAIIRPVWKEIAIEYDNQGRVGGRR
jgi:hypothetical protein